MLRLLASLWRNRHLVRDFVGRDLKARYVGSSMGFFWSVIFPLINLAVYMFVFRLLLSVRWSEGTSPTQTALMMLAGILVWSAFAETLSRSTNCLVENANLIQKVVFPSEILPPYLTLSSVVNMLIGIPILLLGVVFLDQHERLGLAFQPERLGLPLLVLPLLVLLQVLFTSGLGYLLAILNLFLRDTYHVVGVLVTVWMFATPIFYPDFQVDPSLAPNPGSLPKGVTGQYAWILQVNPMYWLIEGYRDVLLRAVWPDWSQLARFLGAALALFAAGAGLFMSQKRSVPDLL